MYLLSKKELNNYESYLEIKNTSSSKMLLSNVECTIIKNPLHLNYNNSIDFKDYNVVYNIVDTVNIEKNDSLSKLLKTKSNDEFKTLLINNYRDESFANQFIEELVNSEEFNKDNIDDIIKAVSELLNEIYYTDRNPKDAITNIRKEIRSKEFNDFTDKMQLFILENRARRFSIISILEKLRGLRKCTLKLSQEKYNLDSLIKHKDCKIIFTNKPFNSIMSNFDHSLSRYIKTSDSYTTLYFKDMKNVRDKLTKCYNDTKYIYLEKNNVILKELSYLECIKLEDGICGFEKMLNIFEQSNLLEYMITDELITYLDNNNLGNIAKILTSKFKISNNRLKSINEDRKIDMYMKKPSILEMISSRYC